MLCGRGNINLHTHNTMTDLTRIVQVVREVCEPHLPVRRGPGRPPRYPDLRILELGAVQHLQGFTSEVGFFRWLARQENLPWREFPSRVQYSRRKQTLAPILADLLPAIVERWNLHREHVRITDSAPVPVIGYVRAQRSPRFTDRRRCAFGYCAAKREKYFGMKLHLVTSKEGIPVTYVLSPANWHDVRLLPELARRLDRGTILLGDKGYVSAELHAELRREHRVHVVAPKRRNQREKNTPWEKRLLKRRGRIESTIAQLTEHLGLQRLGAKSHAGAESRIAWILFAYLMGVAVNRKLRRPPRHIKALLA